MPGIKVMVFKYHEFEIPVLFFHGICQTSENNTPDPTLKTAFVFILRYIHENFHEPIIYNFSSPIPLLNITHAHHHHIAEIKLVQLFLTASVITFTAIDNFIKFHRL